MITTDLKLNKMEKKNEEDLCRILNNLTEGIIALIVELKNRNSISEQANERLVNFFRQQHDQIRKLKDAIEQKNR